MISGWKLTIGLGLAAGIAIAAWYVIRTWGDDIRKQVYYQMFSDLVEQQNKELSKSIDDLKQQIADRDRIYAEEKKNREAARGVSDKIRERTAGKADGEVAPILRETMAVIYEQQQAEKRN